jgi:hypothetical protein
MTLNFKVQKVQEFTKLADGTYRAQIDNIGQISNNYGNYALVDFGILTPGFEGCIHREKYKVDHPVGISKFSKFCIEIGGLEEGDNFHEENALFRLVDIEIANRTGKDGNTYANVVRHTLVEPQLSTTTASNTPELAPTVQYGNIAIPTTGAPSNQVLNDDVPF